MIRFSFLAILMPLAFTACKAAPNAQVPAARLPAVQFMEQQEPSGAIHGQELYTPAAGARTFVEIDQSGNAGQQYTVVRNQTTRMGASFSDTEEGRGAELWRIDESGNVVMPAHIDYDDNAISQFTPPLLLAPAELNAGQAQQSEAAMRVVDLRNPSKVKEIGRASRSIEYVADQRIRTPMGEFTAKKIEVHFTAKLRLAEADEQTTLYFVPNVGIVAAQSEVKVKVLGALSSTRRRSVALKSIDDSSGSIPALP